MPVRRLKKEQRDFLKLMEAEGYHLHRIGRHMVFRHPCGVQFVTGATPGDCRARKHAIADAKRLVRGRS